jgi:hypothetical protein
MNVYGMKRMCRGIFSLQQSLQRILSEAQLVCPFGHLED